MISWIALEEKKKTAAEAEAEEYDGRKRKMLAELSSWVDYKLKMPAMIFLTMETSL